MTVKREWAAEADMTGSRGGRRCIFATISDGPEKGRQVVVFLDEWMTKALDAAAQAKPTVREW